jgi:predicted phage terminase large subunit-like protein
MSQNHERLKNDAQYKTLIELGLRDPKGLIKRLQSARCAQENGLYHFVKLMWPLVEPTRDFVDNWHIHAICEHMEAVTNGEITRLLINIPPGHAKSLLTSVFYPAWEWGPKKMSSMRYLCASYSQDLTIRDNVRFRQIITSDLYREYWGAQFDPSPIQFSLTKVANTKTGWKLATSVGGVGTGERGDRVICDDPNSVKDAESDKVRDSTNQWLTEVLPTRLNDPQKSAIIIIQQRTHEEDASGTVLAREMGYEHLMIPMRYDSTRRYTTCIGWTDPRGVDDAGNEVDADGSLLWPEMYPERIAEQLEKDLGPYAASGQLQQAPVPRGGAIFDRDWWQPWDIGKDGKIRFPAFDYVIGSVDTAFTEKQSNDFSAMTVWGVFRHTGDSFVMPRHIDDPNEMMRIAHNDYPRVMLMYGWQKRLSLHGPPEERPLHVSTEEWDSPHYRQERQKSWGLVEWVAYTAKRYRIDQLIIETQAAGHSLEQELRRLHAGADYGLQLINAKGDKTSRAFAVQHLFSNGLVHAPMYPDSGLPPTWAGTVIDQFSSFPKTRYKDIVDSGTHALQHLRDMGILVRREEHDQSHESAMRLPGKRKPLYDV